MTRAERLAIVKQKAANRCARAARLAETMSYAEVGKRMGVSRQRAFQMVRKHRNPDEERAR